jgi:L-threonylcarbamoyladenylate synthase
MTCPIGADIRLAASMLREGGLVAFATETVYGLGADARNLRAIARLFDVKDRPRFDPLIVHIADVSRLDEIASEVPLPAKKLAAAFWPGPLTLVLPKTDIIPDLITSGLPTVAVRIPAHSQALDLLRTADVPLAAPSANLFGRLSPTTAQHVAEQLSDQIDYILDGGPCRIGVESTVLQFAGNVPRLLRPGGLPLEEIESVIGPVTVAAYTAEEETKPRFSPGQLPRHYSPSTPLVVQAAGDPLPRAARQSGLLTICCPADTSKFATVEILSADGDLTEAAAGFFGALRRLDAMHLDLIVAEPFPEHGLGRALNDRLRRAAHTSPP